MCHVGVNLKATGVSAEAPVSVWGEEGRVEIRVFVSFN